MRVRALTSMVEGQPPLARYPGDEFEISDASAVALMRVGAVERVDSSPETAAAPIRGERATRFARPVR